MLSAVIAMMLFPTRLPLSVTLLLYSTFGMLFFYVFFFFFFFYSFMVLHPDHANSVRPLLLAPLRTWVVLKEGLQSFYPAFCFYLFDLRRSSYLSLCLIQTHSVIERGFFFISFSSPPSALSFLFRSLIPSFFFKGADAKNAKKRRKKERKRSGGEEKEEQKTSILLNDISVVAIRYAGLY
eukprot:TRINITY_DN5905_c0_g1_i1.p1 TRINITY_DN5905_c0_g1~~TRINITY_DN5905_c0_g1_i1.p1  ORF type:complete len:181 (+),score=9.72 TRINITY_DN5905_c0_g1_i1:10-552(+)